MKRKKWVIAKGDKELAATLGAQLNIDPLAALIVSSRGLKNENEIADFFDEDAPLSVDPFSIKDMDRAAKRVNSAIDNFEKICVYGDYDADGVTATALLYSFLESMGANVIRYIPDRIDEGYGLNNPAVDKLKEFGVKLIVTVDTGATAIDEVKYAYENGLEVVVTDHHQVADTLPQCEAVVDPHRGDCMCPFKEMSGVGVAFKLACAVNGGDYETVLDEYGELVALGTIGDVVTLTGENRVMVRRGIRSINEHPGVGIAALIEQAGIANKEFNSSLAAFTICPRLNAAGRMGSADKALDLLLCDDPEAASDLAKEINAMNIARQSTESDILEAALIKINQNPEIKNGRIIVVDGEGWHQGVIGIVAAKLTERFARPAIVISRGEKECKGSCRSIPGFSIYDAIDAVSDTLTHYGGHTLAAGIGLLTENVELFRRRINEYAADKEIPFVQQKIDLKIQPGSISLGVLSAVSSIEPFGAGNPQPCFGLFGVTIEEINGISEGNKHTRLLISKNGVRVSALFFNVPANRFPFERGDTVDLAVNLEKNVYNGEVRVSTIIKSIRSAGTDEEKVLGSISVYNKLSRNEALSDIEKSRLLPDREIQAQVYRAIKGKPLKDKYCEELCVRLDDDGEKLAKYMTAVDTMLEMGVLNTDSNECVKASCVKGKVNLDNSLTMQKLRA